MVGGASGRESPGQPVLYIRTIVLNKQCFVKPDSGIGGRKEDGLRRSERYEMAPAMGRSTNHDLRNERQALG